MKLNLRYLKLIIGLTVAITTLNCVAQEKITFPSSSVSMGDITSSNGVRSTKIPSNDENISIYIGKYHLLIPHRYLAKGSYSIQTSNHLALDVQLPDIRSMTDEERNDVTTTGRMLPNTAHIILEAGDHLLYGEKMFDRMTVAGNPDIPPIIHLQPIQSDISNMIVFHNNFISKDIYLLKDSYPRFFFDCDKNSKFSKNPHCFYYGQLIGNVQFQIWYQKNAYIDQIVTLTPKIRSLLESFIVP